MKYYRIANEPKTQQRLHKELFIFLAEPQHLVIGWMNDYNNVLYWSMGNMEDRKQHRVHFVHGLIPNKLTQIHLFEEIKSGRVAA